MTFRNLPLHNLIKFSFKDLAAASESFKKIPGISECVIVQTQSRVEIFTVNELESDSPDLRTQEGKNLIIKKIQDTWKSLSELEQYDVDHFDQILEVYVNNDVYLHLLRLACGLESVVVGHDTILDRKSTRLNSSHT